MPMTTRGSFKFLSPYDEDKSLICNIIKHTGLSSKSTFTSDKTKNNSTLDLSNITTDENANYINESYKSDSFCIPNDNLHKYESFDSPRIPMPLPINKKRIIKKKNCAKLKPEITGIHWEGAGKKTPLKLTASSSINLVIKQPITLDNTPPQGKEPDLDDELVKKYFIKYKMKYEMMKSIMFYDQIGNSFGSMLNYNDLDLERKYATKYKMKFIALKLAQSELSNSNTK